MSKTRAQLISRWVVGYLPAAGLFVIVFQLVDGQRLAYIAEQGGLEKLDAFALLAGHYLGVGCLIPGIGAILARPAIICGILGIAKANSSP